MSPTEPRAKPHVLEAPDGREKSAAAGEVVGGLG